MMPKAVSVSNNSATDSLRLVKSSLDQVRKKRSSHSQIIGESQAIRNVFNIIDKVACTDSIILIHGETGTGKGLVAREIHLQSNRHQKSFVTINCGAIPENLLESELFGHERGAFTGATSAKPGKFELADGGTIFLDEIGDMSPDLQVKLLRILEENEFERVGGVKTIRANVRVIAATHRNLKEKVKEGTFREDLFYRLCVIPITLPALKDRRSDIPLLIEYFMGELNRNRNQWIEGISNGAMHLLTSYSWPGNVRELKNYVERMVVLNNGQIVNQVELGDSLDGNNQCGQPFQVELSDEGICFNTAVKEYEKALILQSLEKSRWIKNKAAKLLGLKRTTLVEKIKRHQIES